MGKAQKVIVNALSFDFKCFCWCSRELGLEDRYNCPCSRSSKRKVLMHKKFETSNQIFR